MKYPDDFINKVICGDSLKVMQGMPEKCIDCVITDSPYGTNYGKIIGDDTLETFSNSIPQIFRILKDDTFYITYCFPLYVPEIIEKARQSGFIYKWIGFNYYPNMFKQKPQPLGYNRYDLFLIFAKGYPKKKGYIKDTIHYVLDKKNNKERLFGHPHQKPGKCGEKLVKATLCEGDLLLDPFCGSGVFLAEAKKKGVNYIGIDIEKKYCKMSRKRLCLIKKQLSN